MSQPMLGNLSIMREGKGGYCYRYRRTHRLLLSSAALMISSLLSEASRLPRMRTLENPDDFAHRTSCEVNDCLREFRGGERGWTMVIPGDVGVLEE